MNNEGILSKRDESIAISNFKIPILNYEGEFNVRLVCREWGNSMNLKCYFENEDGSMFWISAFRHRSPEPEIYAPRKCHIDFTLVNDNTYWKCLFETNKKGNINWLTAEQIDRFHINHSISIEVDEFLKTL